MGLRKRLSVLVTGVMTLALTVGITSQAHASYPIATNERNQWLAANPPSDAPWATVSKTQGIIAGCYWWRLWWAGSPVQGGDRYIYLATDTYTWIDTLIPGPFYLQTSMLYANSGDYPGGATNPGDPNSYIVQVVSSDTMVQWGSTLQWLHDGYCLSVSDGSPAPTRTAWAGRLHEALAGYDLCRFRFSGGE